MGGRSSSSSQQENKQVNQTVDTPINSAITTTSGDKNQIFEHLEQSTAFSINGKNATVAVTDHGAVQQAIGGIVDSTNRAFETVEAATGASLAAMQSTSKQAQTGGASVITDSITAIFRPIGWGLLALAVVLVLFLILKGGKRV